MAAATATGKNPPDQKESEKLMADKRKPTLEIDEIFQGAKGKKKRKEPAGDQGGERKDEKGSDLKKKVKRREGEEGRKEKKKGKKKKGMMVGVDKGAEGRARRRRTGDGLTIYSAEELGVGNPDAGGTPLCPFDCSCCF